MNTQGALDRLGVMLQEIPSLMSRAAAIGDLDTLRAALQPQHTNPGRAFERIVQDSYRTADYDHGADIATVRAALRASTLEPEGVEPWAWAVQFHHVRGSYEVRRTIYDTGDEARNIERLQNEDRRDWTARVIPLGPIRVASSAPSEIPREADMGPLPSVRIGQDATGANACGPLSETSAPTPIAAPKTPQPEAPPIKGAAFLLVIEVGKTYGQWDIAHIRELAASLLASQSALTDGPWIDDAARKIVEWFHVTSHEPSPFAVGVAHVRSFIKAAALTDGRRSISEAPRNKLAYGSVPGLPTPTSNPC